MVEAKEEFTETEIVAFEQKYLQVFKDLAHLESVKKKIEEQSKSAREKIEAAMDEYGITKIENEFVSISMVPENPGKKTIDLKKLSEEEPEEYESLLEDYPKISGKKKAYVRITIKEGNDNEK